MYTFQITDCFLSIEERALFKDYLDYKGLDNNIWEVFACLFDSAEQNTQPFLLKIYEMGELIGVIILIRCKNYGKTLFNNRLMAGMVNLVNIPFYLWVKFGCGMDMMSNPGFVKDPLKTDEVFSAALLYLKKNSILSIVNDYSENKYLHRGAAKLPALPHALIDCSSMHSLDDYIKSFKNIKKKIKTFRNKQGEYQRVEGQLDPHLLESLKKCFLVTSEKSVFYLPYQDLYLNATINTSSRKLDQIYYFIATINGEFLGYQAAIKTGKYLNALHGAFDRFRKTTFHAYDILFVKMTEFALENSLSIVDFGVLINHTKGKMTNKTENMSYYIYSKYTIIKVIFRFFLKITKIQGSQQMQFRS